MKRSAASLLTLLLAGCATAPGATAAAPEGRDCFNVNSVSGFSIVDARTVRLNVSPSRSYDLDTSPSACIDLRDAETIAVRSRPSSFLCVGEGPGVDARVITGQGDRCRVLAVRRAPDARGENGSGDAADPDADGGDAG